MNATVWLISFTDSTGKRAQTVHTHNCVADFRTIDPNATAQEIDCAAVAELIDADREYDAAMSCEADTDGMLRRESARARRRAAIARVGAK